MAWGLGEAGERAFQAGWLGGPMSGTCSLPVELNPLLSPFGIPRAYADQLCCWLEPVPCGECDNYLWYSCNDKEFYFERDHFSGPACQVVIRAEVYYERHYGDCADVPDDAVCVTSCNSTKECTLEDALVAYKGDPCDCPNDPHLNAVLNMFHYTKKVAIHCFCLLENPGG